MRPLVVYKGQFDIESNKFDVNVQSGVKFGIINSIFINEIYILAFNREYGHQIEKYIDDLRKQILVK